MLVVTSSHISYFNPGWKDTVYMGKDASGERVYTEKYLLWNLREIITMFNSDQNENAFYHTLHQAVAETKNIFTSNNIKGDDCHCPSVRMYSWCWMQTSRTKNKTNRTIMPGPWKLTLINLWEV